MKRGRPRHNDVLTPREWQVLTLLQEGLTNEQIAGRLGISRNTTKFHVAEILGKLGVPDREAAARWQPGAATRRSLRGFGGILPAKLLFPAVASKPGLAVLSAAIIVSFVAVAGLSMSGLSRVDFAGVLSPSAGSADQNAMPAAQPQVQITDVRSSSFHTTIEFDVYLAQRLGSDESASVAAPGLRFAAGEPVAGVAVSQNLLPNGVGLRVTAEFPTPLQGEAFTLLIDELAVVPHDGDGRVIARELSAPGRVSGPATAQFIASASGARIDTGYGWSYVVDTIEFDAATVRVTYHVEGATESLVALPLLAEDGVIAVPFPEDGVSGSVLVSRAGAEQLRLVFGAAGRPVDQSVSFRLARDEMGAWQALAPASVPEVTAIQVTEEGYLSLRLDAEVAFTGRGSPGNHACLTDDRGNAYALYHGSGAFPPRYSQWDFTGPVAADAQELLFELPGHLAIEHGAWELLLDLE